MARTAVTASNMQQLDLFDPPPAAHQTASQKQPGTGTPTAASGHAGGGLTPCSSAIPARCPVTGRRFWCVRGDCRHWGGGRCAHPEAVSRLRRRRARVGAAAGDA